MINQLIFKFNDFVNDSSKIDIDLLYLEDNYYNKEYIDESLDVIGETLASNVSSLMNDVDIIMTSLDDYATKEDLENIKLEDYPTNSSISDNYAKKTDLNNLASFTYVDESIETFENNYPTNSSISDNYAKKSEIEGLVTQEYADIYYQPKGDYLTRLDVVNKQDKLTDEQLANLDLDHSIFLTEHQDLSDYPTKQDLEDYYQPKGDYLTEIPGEYIKETDVDTKLSEYVLYSEYKDEYNTLESIIKGKNRAHVFDTEDEMNTWIESNADSLEVGDNLYIKEVNVPDYWWDGEKASELETQKVDLSEYAKSSDIPTDYLSTTTTGLQSVKSSVTFDGNVSIGNPTNGNLKTYHVARQGSDGLSYGGTYNMATSGAVLINRLYNNSIVDATMRLNHNGIQVRYTDTAGEDVNNKTFYTVLDSKNYINYFEDAEFNKALSKTYVTNTSVNINYAKKSELDNYATKESIADLQLYKFPNATIYGTPTINNGQVTNFSPVNYLQFPFIVNFLNRNFEILMCITTGSDVTTQLNLFDSAFGLAIAIRNERFVIAYSTNGTSWNAEMQTTTQNPIQANTTYYARLKWDGQLLDFNYSYDNTNWLGAISSETSTTPYPKQIIIGKSIDNRYPFKGIINLNYCSLTIADKVVWTGMDDVGLATRLAVDMSNIDAAGEQKIKDIIGPIPEAQEPQDLTNYATKTYVDDQVGDIKTILESI